jgi:hypothetical protein
MSLCRDADAFVKGPPMVGSYKKGPKGPFLALTRASCR